MPAEARLRQRSSAYPPKAADCHWHSPTLCPPEPEPEPEPEPYTLTRWVFVQRCVPETRGVPLERLSDLMKREGDAKPGAKTE